jgi:hypothetical protein
MQLLHQTKPNAPQEWLEKLPTMTKRLEESLYRSAPSFDAYNDINTLKQRLQQSAMTIGTKLRDRDLFTQPDESHLGECSICCLPMPLVPSKSMLMSCCSKTICRGCHDANKKREKEAGLEHRCAFCREPFTKSHEEAHKRLMARIKKNDPVALCQMGNKHYHEGDYETALKYFTKGS